MEEAVLQLLSFSSAWCSLDSESITNLLTHSEDVPIKIDSNVDLVLKRLSKEQKYVIKLDKGSKGKQVSIVSGMAETKSVLDTIGSMNHQLIIQEFIESNYTDIRAIVVGDEVVAAYQRNAGNTELRTNISKGGEGVHIETFFCGFSRPFSAHTLGRLCVAAETRCPLLLLSFKA